MAAPVLETLTTYVDGAGLTSAVITKPTGTVEGNLLLMLFAGGRERIAPLTPPSGWTLLEEADFTRDGAIEMGVIYVAYKVAGASEPADYTFNFAASGVNLAAMLRISGVNAASIISEILLGAVTTSTSRNTPSVVAPAADSLLITFCAVGRSAHAPYTTPGGTTEIFDLATSGASTSTNTVSGVGGQEVVASGATGTRTYTASSANSSSHIGIAVAVGPTAAAPVLEAAVGSFVLTGQAATLRQNYKVQAQAGTFALTGVAAGLKASRKLAAAVGAFALTGQDATLTFVPGNPILVAGAGSFALTGISAALVAERRIAASVGAFTLSGQDAGLIAARKIAPVVGAFVLSGQAVDFEVIRTLVAGTGSYVLTGQNAALVYNAVAEGGTFVLSGQDVGLRASRRLGVEVGAFALTGEDATLLVGATMVAEPGAFVLTGQDANLGAQLISAPIPLVFPITQRRKPKKNPYLHRFGTRY